jgi:hypothetical protein
MSEIPSSEPATKEDVAQIQAEIIGLREMVRELIDALHESRETKGV